MFTVRSVSRLHGTIRPPSDKSLTHRALMFGAIAEGTSTIINPLLGEDCLATARIIEQLGSSVRFEGNEKIEVTGGLWREPIEPLDCGNSGTTMRLMCGLLAGKRIPATLIGDASLSGRPMMRIIEPLSQMGAKISGSTPPLQLSASPQLHGIQYQSPVASAQVKSAILLAGLHAEGVTEVEEPSKSRDHTERMLSAMGAKLEVEGNTVRVQNSPHLERFTMRIPADISSAAFWIVAGLMIPDSEVELRDVGVNPSRTGILDVVALCQGSVVQKNERLELGEPIADLQIYSSPNMQPFSIGGSLVPRLIDEIPILAVLATQLPGVSTFRDAAELRVKESDRIESIAQGLRAMGANIETHPDGLDIFGPTPLHGAEIHAGLDHRIAMAFTIAGLIAEGPTTIHGFESVHTSYPQFQEHLESLAQYHA